MTNTLMFMFAPVRLSESLYSVKGVGQGGLSVDDIDGLVQRASRQHSCLPVALPENSKRADMIEEPLMHAEREPKRRTLLGHAFYVDGDVSDELRSKVGLGCYKKAQHLINFSNKYRIILL